MTEYQEAGCSTGWMQQLETSTLINTNGRYSYTNDKLSNSLATFKSINKWELLLSPVCGTNNDSVQEKENCLDQIYAEKKNKNVPQNVEMNKNKNINK